MLDFILIFLHETSKTVHYSAVIIATAFVVGKGEKDNKTATPHET